MRFRKLRIAVSVFFVVVTMAICVMWVRSYWKNDVVTRADNSNTFTTLGSNYGAVYLFLGSGRFGPGWVFWSGEVSNGSPENFHLKVSAKGGTSIQGPYWFITPLVAAAALLPWIKRFSLRAMLIVTTLIAVALGGIVILRR